MFEQQNITGICNFQLSPTASGEWNDALSAEMAELLWMCVLSQLLQTLRDVTATKM